MKLYWSLMNACNLACRYCYYNSGLETRVTKFTNPLEYPRVLDDLSRSFDEFVFTGGEPLLCRYLFDLMGYFKSKGKTVGLLTNATLLTEAMAQKIVDTGVDSVAISLDSLDNSLNDYLRGKTKEAKTGLEHILRVRPKTMKVEIMQTVTKLNYASIPDLVAFCKKKGLQLWLDPVEINSDVTRLTELDLQTMTSHERAKLRTSMEAWAGKNMVLRAYTNNCLDVLEHKKPKTISCPMGTESFILDPDGIMYPCFLRKDIRMGNIYETPLKEILENERLQKQQPSLQSAKCVKLGCVCMTIASRY